MRVPVRGRSLNEVLSHWRLLMLILHLGGIVVCDLYRLVLGGVQRVSSGVGADARRLMKLNASPRGIVHAVRAALVL